MNEILHLLCHPLSSFIMFKRNCCNSMDANSSSSMINSFFPLPMILFQIETFFPWELVILSVLREKTRHFRGGMDLARFTSISI